MSVKTLGMLSLAGSAAYLFYRNSNRITHSQHRLQVEIVSPQNYPHLAQTARTWSKTAYKMSESSPQFRHHFFACSKISGIVADQLQQVGRFPVQDVYVCKDEKGREQAIMLAHHWKFSNKTDQNYLFISSIVTHPRNIRCPENLNNPERVEGAGSLLMRFAEKRALALGKDSVVLDSYFNSRPFYEKMGYTSVGNRGMVKKVKQEIAPNVA